MYYVYEFYIVSTGEIIYAGKGTGRRYKVRYGRNKLLTDMLNKYECESRIVKEFEDEQEAFEYEYQYIEELRAKGQCVCNIHCGGAGGSGEYWTDELRKEYSQNNPMKDIKQRERMSQNNPMKNPEVANRVGEQKRKAVYVGNTRYASVKVACKELHTTSSTIQTWCKKGVNQDGEKCHYEGQEQVEFTDSRYNKGGCKSVLYQGIEYESAVDFAKAVGISKTTAYVWLKRGFNPDGIPCRFKDDTRELQFENRHVVRNKNRAKQIIINGIKYKSCSEASEILQIPKSTIYSYLQGKKFNPKYICEYDNQ